MSIVAKFGGSSLANAKQFGKVVAIIRADPARRYVVVSAPGKMTPGDKKVTDMLLDWSRCYRSGLPCEEIQQAITARFVEIVTGLGLSLDIHAEMAKIAQNLHLDATSDFLASRGEFLNAKILAEALGYDFIDPAGCIHLDREGRYSSDNGHLAAALKGRRAVIAGFYGSLPDGSIKTFSRGGSDITGALVAQAVNARRYENWTDVSGLLRADPRVVEHPRHIRLITYDELRELAYMGAEVFHAEAMFPVQDAGIETHIRNTNRPQDPGTRIVPDSGRHVKNGHATISGIAGRKNFTIIRIQRRLMDKEIGFGERVLKVIAERGISFEHMPGGIDTLSVIIDDRQLGDKLDGVVAEITRVCSPGRVTVEKEVALIAVVGRGMVHRIGASARVLRAIARANINVKVVNQGSSEMNIIIVVRNCDYEKAVRAIYRTFVR